MKACLEPLQELPDFMQMQEDIQKNHLPIQVNGCIDAQKVHFCAALSGQMRCRLIVTYDEQKARNLYEDFLFFDRGVCLYPAKDIMFYTADVHGSLLTRQRLQVILRILEGEPVTVITTMDALMDRLLPPETFRENIIELMPEDSLDIGRFARKLTQKGYVRVEQVENPGEFAIRGGILDVFDMTQEFPYRIELWGDEVDSIRSFDPQSQRSLSSLERIRIFPAGEYILSDALVSEGTRVLRKKSQEQAKRLKDQGNMEAASRLIQTMQEQCEMLEETPSLAGLDSLAPILYGSLCSFIDYFPKEETLWFLDEPERLREKGIAEETLFQESMTIRMEKGYLMPEQIEARLGTAAVFQKLGRQQTILLSVFGRHIRDIQPVNEYSVNVRSINPYNGDFELLVKDLKNWMSMKYRVVLVCRSASRGRHLAADLREEYELPAFYTQEPDRTAAPGEILISHGPLPRGVEYPLLKFSMVAESDIFGAGGKKKKRPVRPREGQAIKAFSELVPGDYVIHESHGIGIYQGMEKLEVDGILRDYMKIRYADGGNLYIPPSQMDVISKYSGAEGAKPKLNSLSGPDWAKTRTRVRKAVREVAQDLINLYAARETKTGYAFSPDTVWQQEFEEMFPYEETEGQLNAIEDTKRDMESPKIMDRLICGDVGFGKTEVAIRAAFKAVQDSKQVAILVPTTILAQQHYYNFCERLKEYPIRVDLLCRFRTGKQQKETLEQLRRGTVDILIGTHRILSQDVVFKDLGLLVVDEEQRFGVAHKEKIKKLKDTVDVLTLTATPIPRTLQMSLVGIRDMSMLEEAPRDRMPIQTYVLEYDDEMVREAISRELARGGQVYYIYNRVHTIADMAARIQAMVPEALVAYAHGQMKERELERIMYSFINGEIDVLVSTTIVENGLDIQNVNTIIVHDADRLGLAQLYQLRGRVGRSNRTAYAFFLFRKGKILKEEAEKRLTAIREFTELGSGVKIAMRDLQIRGAGSLIGEKQSGHIEAVGYDLYCKMLAKAVQEIRGGTVIEDFETEIDLNISAYIPPRYIPSESRKLEAYKRIAAISSEQEFEEMADELMDRYGELPKEVLNLLNIALLKAMAHEAGITCIRHRQNVTTIEMFPKAKVDGSRIPLLVEKYRNAMKFHMGKTPYFTVRTKSGAGFDLIKCEKILIGDIRTLLPEETP